MGSLISEKTCDELGVLMTRKTTVLVMLMWVSLGVVHAFSRYTDMVKYNSDATFSLTDVGYYILSYASWMVVTLGLIRVINNPGSSLSYRRLAAIFIGGALIWLPAYFAYDYGMSTWVANGGWAEWIERFRSTSGSIVFFYGVVYALTFALCVGFVFSARARQAHLANIELERKAARTTLELAEQQMQLMQSQLSPHFLFNALSAISYLARRGEREALTEAVAQLGTLLRFTIQNASQTSIALMEEIQFAKDYVSLQSLRFGDRFDCVFNQGAHLESLQCLPFSLQPIIENVFQHVVEQMAEQIDTPTAAKIDIKVSVSTSDNRIIMVVSNTRLANEPDDSASIGHGTGLKNLETRLAHVYGVDFSLRTAQTPSEFKVTLSFPCVQAIEHD